MDQSHIVAVLTTAIGNMGFPIVVTGYLLLRFEKKIDALSSIIQQFMHALKDDGDMKK